MIISVRRSALGRDPGVPALVMVLYLRQSSMAADICGDQCLLTLCAVTIGLLRRLVICQAGATEIMVISCIIASSWVSSMIMSPDML